MSENPVAADPWGLPVETPVETPVEAPAEERVDEATSAPASTDSSDATLAAQPAAPIPAPPEPPIVPHHAGADPGITPAAIEDSEAASPSHPDTLVHPVDTLEGPGPDLFPGDGSTPGIGEVNRPEPNAPAFDTSTEAVEQTFENYELALPSTPEPRVEINTPDHTEPAADASFPAAEPVQPNESVGLEPDMAAEGGTSDDITDADTDTDIGSDWGDTVWSAADEPQSPYGDTDLASIADEISSLSDVLGESDDLELTRAEPSSSDPDIFDAEDLPDDLADDSSVLAAISELEPPSTAAIDPSPAPAEIPNPESHVPPAMDFTLSLDPTPTPGRDAQPEETSSAEPTEALPASSTPAPPAWAVGLGGGSSLFGDPNPAVPTAGTDETQHDAAASPAGPSTVDSTVDGTDTAPSAGSSVGPVVDQTTADETTQVVSETHHARDAAGSREPASDLQAVTAVTSPMGDIPDDMPSWAVDYDGARAGSTPAPAARNDDAEMALPANGLADGAASPASHADGDEPPTGAIEAQTHTADTTPDLETAGPGAGDIDEEAPTMPVSDDPWAPPAQSGLDRPYTSQPVPSAYKELENLPPPLVTGREADASAAEQTPHAAPAPHAQSASDIGFDADAEMAESSDEGSGAASVAPLDPPAAPDAAGAGEGGADLDTTPFGSIEPIAEAEEALRSHPADHADDRSQVAPALEWPLPEAAPSEDDADQPTSTTPVETAAQPSAGFDLGAQLADPDHQVSVHQVSPDQTGQDPSGQVSAHQDSDSETDMVDGGPEPVWPEADLFPGTVPDDDSTVPLNLQGVPEVAGTPSDPVPDIPASDPAEPMPDDEAPANDAGESTSPLPDASFGAALFGSAPSLFASPGDDAFAEADTNDTAPSDTPPSSAGPDAGMLTSTDFGFGSLSLDPGSEAPPVAAGGEPPSDTPAMRNVESSGDLRASAAEEAAHPGADDSPQIEGAAPGDTKWASKWAESAQGWVVGPDGETTWRPIVATSAALDGWDAETYLGLVSGEAVVVQDLASGRSVAIARMVDEGLARGAHALVGVNVSYHSVADHQVAVATGTAVTLTPAD